MGLFDFLSNLFGGDDSGNSADARTDAAGAPAGDEPPDDDTPVDEYGPADFRAEAEDFAERHEDENLDFTVESLARLDDFAEGQGEILGILGEEMEGDNPLVTRMEGGYTLWFGSYLGEVLVRQFDGEWAADEDGWGVAVPVDEGPFDVPVFDVAAQSVTDEPVLHEVATEVSESLDGAGRADEARADAETEMGAEAVELAEYWSEHDLDFSPASLQRLDDLVDEQWDEERFRAAELGDTETMDGRVLTGLVKQLGSYYGEVLVRNLDAEWTETDDMGTAVEVTAGGGGAGEGDGTDDGGGERDDEPQSATVNVFHIAEDCLTEPSKFALNYDVVVDRLGIDAPTVGGEGEVLAVDPDEIDEAAADLDAEEVIDGFAEDAAALVEEWPAYDLDYSPGSLSRLDDLVTEEFADFDFEGVELGDETDGDSLFLTAHAMETGSYLAEVFRRHLGAEWRLDDGTVLVVRGREAEAQLDPVGIAAACFRGEDSFAATFEAVRGRLGLEVDE